jgi:hypothetical protein
MQRDRAQRGESDDAPASLSGGQLNVDTVKEFLRSVQSTFGGGISNVVVSSEMSPMELLSIVKRTESEILERLQEIKDKVSSRSDEVVPQEDVIVDSCAQYDASLRPCTPGVDCPPGNSLSTGVIEVDHKTGVKRMCVSDDDAASVSFLFDANARKRFEVAMQKHKNVAERLLSHATSMRKVLEEAGGTKSSAEGAKNLRDINEDVGNMIRVSSEFLEDPRTRVMENPHYMMSTSDENSRNPPALDSNMLAIDMPLGACETAQTAGQCDYKRDLAAGASKCVWTPDLLVYKQLDTDPDDPRIAKITESGFVGDDMDSLRELVKSHALDGRLPDYVDPYEVTIQDNGKVVSIRADHNAEAQTSLIHDMFKDMETGIGKKGKCLPARYFPYLRTSAQETPQIRAALVNNMALRPSGLDPGKRDVSLATTLDPNMTAAIGGGGARGIGASTEYERLTRKERYFINPTRPAGGSIKVHSNIGIVWNVVMDSGRRVLLEYDKEKKDPRFDRLRSSLKMCLRELNKAKVEYEKKLELPVSLTVAFRTEDKKMRRTGKVYQPGVAGGGSGNNEDAGYQRAVAFWRSIGSESSFYDARMTMYSSLGILLTTMFDLDEGSLTDEEVKAILTFEDQVVRSITSRPGGQCSLASVFDTTSHTPINYRLPPNVKGGATRGRELNLEMDSNNSELKVPVVHYVVMTKNDARHIGAGPFMTYTDNKGAYAGIVPLYDDKVVSSGSCVVLTGMLSEILSRHPTKKYEYVLAQYARSMYGEQISEEFGSQALKKSSALLKAIGDPDKAGGVEAKIATLLRQCLAESTNSRIRSARSHRVSSSSGSIKISSSFAHSIVNLCVDDASLAGGKLHDELEKSLKKVLPVGANDPTGTFSEYKLKVDLEVGGRMGQIRDHILKNYTRTLYVPKYAKGSMIGGQQPIFRHIRDMENKAMDTLSDGFVPSIMEMMTRALNPSVTSPDIFDQVIPISTKWLTDPHHDYKTAKEELDKLRSIFNINRAALDAALDKYNRATADEKAALKPEVDHLRAKDKVLRQRVNKSVNRVNELNGTPSGDPGDTPGGLDGWKRTRLYYAAALACFLPKRMLSIGPGGVGDMCKMLEKMGWLEATDSTVLRFAIVKRADEAKGQGAYRYLYFNDHNGSHAVYNQRIEPSRQAGMYSYNSMASENLSAAVASMTHKFMKGSGPSFSDEASVVNKQASLFKNMGNESSGFIGDDTEEAIHPENEVGSIVIDSTYAAEFMGGGASVKNKAGNPSLILKKPRAALPLLQVAQAENGRAALYNSYESFRQTPKAYEKSDPGARGTFASSPKDIRVGYMSLYREYVPELLKDSTSAGMDKDRRRLLDNGIIDSSDPLYDDRMVTDLWYELIDTLALTHSQNAYVNNYVQKTTANPSEERRYADHVMTPFAKAVENRNLFMTKVLGFSTSNKNDGNVANDMTEMKIVDVKRMQTDMMLNLFDNGSSPLVVNGQPHFTYANIGTDTNPFSVHGTGMSVGNKGGSFEDAAGDKPIPERLKAINSTVFNKHLGVILQRTGESLPVITDAQSSMCQLYNAVNMIEAIQPLYTIQPMGYDLSGKSRSQKRTEARDKFKEFNNDPQGVERDEYTDEQWERGDGYNSDEYNSDEYNSDEHGEFYDESSHFEGGAATSRTARAAFDAAKAAFLAGMTATAFFNAAKAAAKRVYRAAGLSDADADAAATGTAAAAPGAAAPAGAPRRAPPRRPRGPPPPGPPPPGPGVVPPTGARSYYDNMQSLDRSKTFAITGLGDYYSRFEPGSNNEDPQYSAQKTARVQLTAELKEDGLDHSIRLLPEVDYTRECSRVIYQETPSGGAVSFPGLAYDICQPSHHAVVAYTKMLKLGYFGSTYKLPDVTNFRKLLAELRGEGEARYTDEANTADHTDSCLIYGLTLHYVLHDLLSTLQSTTAHASTKGMMESLKTIATREVLRDSLREAMTAESQQIVGAKEAVSQLTSGFQALVVESKMVALPTFDPRSLDYNHDTAVYVP